MFDVFKRARPAPKLGRRAPDKFAKQQPGGKDWDIAKLGLVKGHGQGTDLSPLCTVLNQGGLSSCVAHAWEGAILVEARKLGFSGSLGELQSLLFGYFNSRAEHGDQWSDTGTFLRTYAYARKRQGNCPQREWKYDESKCNTRPPTKTYQRAYATRGIRGFYRIFDEGASRIDAVISALDARHPVVFGMRVDEAFINYAGPSRVGVPSGPIIGGHAMAIVGYNVLGRDQYEFKVLNSWGTDWREDGFVWFNDELIATWLEDPWVVSLES
jgi:C1A family cysteine protease